VRRLIINADDFGLTAGVNRAIAEAHRAGVVTSATLMAVGGEFADAARLSLTLPKLSVGCHVVLADGAPVLDSQEIPSLAKAADGAARLRSSWSRFAAAALAGKLAPQEIEAEAAAQIQRLQSAGIAVSHLDTHKHTHIFPQVLRALLRAAKSCGVRAVRNPFGPVRADELARRPGLWKRWLATGALNRYAHDFRCRVAEAGLLTPDGTVGILHTGSMDEAVLAEIIGGLPEGNWELVCHPGYPDEQLTQVRTRLRESRGQELQLLTSPWFRDLLSKCGIDLISYSDFSQNNGFSGR
jgi:hopanoid biosynthesis associated protein HpnK